MKLHHLLAPLALTLAAPLAAQCLAAPPELEVRLLPAAIEFRVTTIITPSMAVVIGALEPTMVGYATMPRLLSDPVILGAGVCGRDGWTLALPEATFPTGIFVYVQGIIVADDVMATRVDHFVLDETWPPINADAVRGT